MIIELQNHLFVITPLGEASCRFINDVGSDIIWGCIQFETNEFWWWKNSEIRYDLHITEGFNAPSQIILSKEREAALAPHMKRYKK